MLLPRYLAALVMTLVVEVPLYVAALAALWRVPVWRAAGWAAGVNLLTHPPLWWSLRPWVGNARYGWLLAAAEIAVCLVEWLLLALLTRPRPLPAGRALLLLVCVGVNAASVLGGLVLARPAG